LKRVLFLCTGNYYRSRFAEELFNVLAPKHGLEWRAESAGLEPTPQNPGPISRHTLAACNRLGIERPTAERFPRRVTGTDFVEANLVIAVKEAEHRAMIDRSFPDHLACVEFWHVHDVDRAAPADTIADLEQRIDELIDRLMQSENESRPTAA
jgi:protein-tyrosine phosphatase